MTVTFIGYIHCWLLLLFNKNMKYHITFIWTRTRDFDTYLICQKIPLNVHAHVCNEASGLILGLSFSLYPYFVYARSKCTDETVCMYT